MLKYFTHIKFEDILIVGVIRSIGEVALITMKGVDIINETN